ncbi:MAG TPA: hypothetical protein VKA48_08480 [Gammaproteobacteria bacterium]|nr:hypothetical protein [Gammaproteobacteria bacterium]
MRISGGELERARVITEDLLEELGLEAYLYEVEPREDAWEIRVECALNEGWQRALLSVERERLLSVPHRSQVRRGLLEEWDGELSACRREARG